MKILMLTPYLPYPPASGGQIRTLNLLKYLSQNHEITLVSLYKNDKEKQYASQLQSFCKKIYVCKRPEKPWQIGNILSAVLTFLPFLIVRNYSVEAKKLIERLLIEEKFDVIHAETFYIMPHIPDTTIPILLVEQTIEFKVYQHFISSLNIAVRLALNIDILKLRYWEKYYWKKATLVAAVSESDQKMIKELEPTINPVTIPNGAGDEMFVTTIPEKNLSNPTLLFVGNFFWLQNIEAAEYLMRKVFPKLVKEIPNIKLVIAGQNIEQKLNVEDLHNNIQIINIAPEDAKAVKDLYKKATVFIAPIYGPGGTRLKILAAMAGGLPVVSTRTGIEGLGVRDREHVLVADRTDEFVNQVKVILSDPDLYNKIQKNAFDRVKKRYSWHAIAKELEIVYGRIR